MCGNNSMLKEKRRDGGREERRERQVLGCEKQKKILSMKNVKKLLQQ